MRPKRRRDPIPAAHALKARPSLLNGVRRIQGAPNSATLCSAGTYGSSAVDTCRPAEVSRGVHGIPPGLADTLGTPAFSLRCPGFHRASCWICWRFRLRDNWDTLDTALYGVCCPTGQITIVSPSASRRTRGKPARSPSHSTPWIGTRMAGFIAAANAR